jgi:hypothetical protein
MSVPVGEVVRVWVEDTHSDSSCSFHLATLCENSRGVSERVSERVSGGGDSARPVPVRVTPNLSHKDIFLNRVMALTHSLTHSLPKGSQRTALVWIEGAVAAVHVPVDKIHMHYDYCNVISSVGSESSGTGTGTGTGTASGGVSECGSSVSADQSKAIVDLLANATNLPSVLRALQQLWDIGSTLVRVGPVFVSIRPDTSTSSELHKKNEQQQQELIGSIVNTALETVAAGCSASVVLSGCSGSGMAVCVNYYIQYTTIQYTTIQYNTIQYNTIQYNTIQYNTIQYNTIQYNTIQYNTTLYSFLLRLWCELLWCASR